MCFFVSKKQSERSELAQWRAGPVLAQKPRSAERVGGGIHVGDWVGDGGSFLREEGGEILSGKRAAVPDLQMP